MAKIIEIENEIGKNHNANMFDPDFDPDRGGAQTRRAKMTWVYALNHPAASSIEEKTASSMVSVSAICAYNNPAMAFNKPVSAMMAVL